MPVPGRAAHRRRLALLAVLSASASHSATRERLIALLWPDAKTDSARRLLSESVYVLRRELGEGVLVSAGDELILDTEVMPSDLVAFRQAVGSGEVERAIDLYAGPFLDGWYLDEAAEFERWVEAERDRLRRVHEQMLADLAEDLERRSEWPAAIARWHELALMDPYSSRAALRLAQAQAAYGERAAALQTLSAHEALLLTELEIEPDADLRAFVRQLRVESASTPAVDSPKRSSVTSVPETDEVGSPFIWRPPAREADIPSTEGSPGEATVPSARTKSAGSRLTPVATVVFLALAMVAVAFVGNRGRDRPAGAASSGDPDRVAVLYMEYPKDGSNLQFIGEDLTHEIINQLSINTLSIAPISEMKEVRDGRLPLDTLLATRRIGTLVEGSIRRYDDQLGVTIRLLDTRTGMQISTGTFSRPAPELFQLEQDLAHFVARALAEHLRRSLSLREADAGTRSPLARKLVVLAQRRREDALVIAAQGHAYDRAAAEEALLGADSLLVRAIREDPHWIRPVLERGLVARERAQLHAGATRHSILAFGLAMAEEALRRSPQNGAALELRGVLNYTSAMALEGQARDTARLRAADRDLRGAVATEPGRATAWLALSFVQTVRGQPAAARVSAARALEQDAYLIDSQDAYFALFASALASDSMQVAQKWCARGHRVHPRDPRFIECELTLMRERSEESPQPAHAWSLVAQLDALERGQPAEPRRAYAPYYRRMVAAAISARAGDRRRVLQEIASARRATAQSKSLSLDLDFDEAYLRLRLGDRATALSLLQRVVKERPMMQRVIERAPLFRELRPEITAWRARSSAGRSRS